MQETPLIGIDLFCGGGGTTTGAESARYLGRKCAKVVACVNHDETAIASHAANFPDCHHFTEDIRTLDVKKLPTKRDYLNAFFFIWASLECTNFSNAKGGQPRDADSRTLAEDLPRYIEHCDPDFILIENVREFMSWGPLDENGKPVDRKKGRDYIKWVETICAMGYHYDYRLLNAADLGAHTSRLRFFGIFAKIGLPIAFPASTHEKDPEKARSADGGLFGMPDKPLEKWKPVREVLNLEDRGKTIFDRKKPLSDKTLQRIMAGLEKYVAKGDTAWITKWHGHKGNSFSGTAASVNQPGPVVTTMNHLGIVQPEFLMQSHGGDVRAKVYKLDRPSRVIKAGDNHSLIQPLFVVQHNGNNPENRSNSLDAPARTLTTSQGGKQNIVQAEFMVKAFSGDPSSKCLSLDGAAGSITCVDHHQLVCLMKYHGSGENVHSPEDPATTIPTKDRIAGVWVESQFLVNPQYTSAGADIDKPCPTIIAANGKRPLSLATAIGPFPKLETFPLNWMWQEGDSPTMERIRAFMAAYGIVDILMRMLSVPELKRITGWEDSYVLLGNQTKQKWMIGNAVPPRVVKAIFEALYAKLYELVPVHASR